MRRIQFSNRKAVGYATAADFLEIFSSEMHGLFLLSLLLTADTEKAEQCFVSALSECMDGMNSFLEWARSWSRRTIIKHAIELIKPALNLTESSSSSCLKWPASRGKGNMIRALLSLEALERFAFVLSIIERQSDHDCALLLGCSRREFVEARAQAGRKLFNSEAGLNPAEEANVAWQAIQLGQKPRASADYAA